MKNISIYIIVLFALIIVGCSGSDTYRGNWKATSEDGTQSDLVFGENDLSVTVNGETKHFEYTQNSVNIKNSVETYGVKLGDGRVIQIHFPIANDESKGAILDANGRPIYIISRDAYLGYEDVYGM